MNKMLLHARYQVLENLRVPMAVVGFLVFPSLMMVFFVVPMPGVADDPVYSTNAAGQLALFSIVNVCLYTFGAQIAEERAKPWDGYLRTLAAGAVPRLGGRVLNGLFFALLGLIPVIGTAAVFTSAEAPVLRILLAVVLLLAIGIPFLLLGLAIGYLLSSKAVYVAVQLLVFPLGFAGGLFLPPQLFPDWLDTASQALPTRAGRDLVVAVLGNGQASITSLAVLLGWTLVFGAFAAFAFRRDEGRRFR
ncbi:ABC transporter permease [Actinoalloteichus hymeniacidonis]|uniref:ABC-type multidrug transport system, permease component n=1 Tax=Actinoalloteichus hymeniacidonis TaxID=340345 RepID=A0AAC9HV11_9PSEU|nr:ABC transporter permease [Actinoalloteichus hymeniacidonis]AOS65651.1 ABC-type multidrug transport system, permease component [Actinoalloteichus hymeniacidonis]MBB5906259.1 ABC-2 type transport system permease protein [Actinoalloteichus hymeniacidonis]